MTSPKAPRSASHGVGRRVGGTLTLVYSARDTEHNDAVVLAEVLRRGIPAPERLMVPPPPLEEVPNSRRSAGFKTAPAGHIEARKFEVFPQIVFAADPDELEEAARGVAVAWAS